MVPASRYYQLPGTISSNVHRSSVSQAIDFGESLSEIEYEESDEAESTSSGYKRLRKLEQQLADLEEGHS